MTRLALRWMCLLTALFAAALGLLHLQPYDDSAARTFLMPPNDCAPPCIMGIRPGYTQTQEALTILQQHPWVKPPVFALGNARRQGVLWNWSGAQPGYIDSSQQGYLQTIDDTVAQITIDTTISLGQVWLIAGKPDVGYITSGFDGKRTFYTYRLIFVPRHLKVWFEVHKPSDLRAMLDARTSLDFFDEWVAPRRTSSFFDPFFKTTFLN